MFKETDSGEQEAAESMATNTKAVEKLQVTLNGKRLSWFFLR